jgi:hypothetical protein
MPMRILRVPVAGDSTDAVMGEDGVYRLEVWSPGLRSADSLGVGTTVRELRSLPGAQALNGEGLWYIQVGAHCGMSFQLAVHESAALDTLGQLDSTQLRLLPDTLSVTKVLLIPCHRGS